MSTGAETMLLVMCDTPGCQQSIPVGGEGHPQICPRCLKEQVNHPSHYQSGGLEAIDVIEAFSLNFRLGNAVKYLLRAGRKGHAKTDIAKARWYIDREIAALEKSK